MIKFLQMTSLALAIASATPAAAEVFGVKMGANPAALGAELQPENAGKPVRPYLLETLPKPHPEFEMLLLTSSAKTGVCKVAALGRYHTDDASLGATFQALRGEMDRQYGASRTYAQDGVTVAAWDFRSGADLPPDVRTIVLEPNATTGGRTYLVARYELANYGDCEAMM